MRLVESKLLLVLAHPLTRSWMPKVCRTWSAVCPRDESIKSQCASLSHSYQPTACCSCRVSLQLELPDA